MVSAGTRESSPQLFHPARPVTVTATSFQLRSLFPLGVPYPQNPRVSRLLIRRPSGRYTVDYQHDCHSRRRRVEIRSAAAAGMSRGPNERRGSARPIAAGYRRLRHGRALESNGAAW